MTRTTKLFMVTALIAAASTQMVMAQKRLVLLEEFTNTACAPCARFAPTLDSTLMARINDVVAIKYHFNFPDSRDPYYLNCAEDIDTRAAYYGITGVPSTIYNGTEQDAYSATPGQLIDQTASSEHTFDISVKASLSNHTLTVDATAKPLSAITTDNMRLFVAVVEEQRSYDKAFPNGETFFYYVMQKMLTGGSGYDITAQAKDGKEANFAAQWTVTNFADEAQLGIVSFVQDLNTGKVYETVYTPYPTGSDDAARVIDITNTPNHICNPKFTSNLQIRNTGANTLTSASINVSINGATQSTPWSGQLQYLDTAWVATPLFTDFTTTTDGSANDVRIWLSDINTTNEQSAQRNVKMGSAPVAQNGVRLTVLTDNKPDETSWQLYNSAGCLIASGGPYTEARHRYTTVLPLEADDCYIIEFHDTGNDGISGANGNGYYKLDQITSDGKAKMLVQDTYTGAGHTQQFSLHNVDISLDIDNAKTSQSGLTTVYDINGNIVTQNDGAANATNGIKTNGVYIIKTNAGNGIKTKKIIK